MSSPSPSRPGNRATAESARRPPPASVRDIDASCRWPVMVLITLALCWLITAGVVAVLASVKLHAPGLLADWPLFTYGRVQPAAWNALVFGFGTQAAFAVTLWMTCRLSRTLLPGKSSILLATLFWNLGVKLGYVEILFGHGTGVEGLEMPTSAALILFLSSLVIVAWGLVAWTRRTDRDTYISQWYLLGALLSFPWVYGAANLLGVAFPLRGVLQAAVGAWFVQGLFVYWFGMVGLAALFYFLPKLTETQVPSRNLALFGFWTLLAFGGFAAMQRYQAGPFPAWMISSGVVAGVMLLFPVLAVGMNLFQVLEGNWRRLWRAEPALRFTALALLAYVVGGLLSVANSFSFVRQTTQFTLFSVALDQLYLIGFFAVAVLGACHYIVPRVTNRPWPSVRLSQVALLTLTFGVILGFLAQAVGGFVQGNAMNDPSLSFVAAARRTLPFLGMATLANLILLAGYLALALNLCWLILDAGREACRPVIRSWRQPEPGEVRT